MSFDRVTTPRARYIVLWGGSQRHGPVAFRGGRVPAHLTTASGEEAGLVEFADNGAADKQPGQEEATVNKWGMEVHLSAPA